MYQGEQQEFQTRRLMPVWVCTVVGQWFIHPQGSVVSRLSDTTFPIGKIFMGYVLLCLMELDLDLDQPLHKELNRMI